ncbi:MAG: radical SAM protein [Cyclobacteriaceae bacterium]|nr:radical SAM protein [Cyclobacteriaceae bacterium]
MTNIYPEKKNLYRLPYSMNDNPIGWIEATDICNIKCKGCYRLIMGEGHKPLEQIKEEILFLRKWRNCDNITLAGGEPILHPHIKEIVAFITSHGMKTVILTNGMALNDKVMQDMKDVGLLGFSFHIDSTQTRPEFKKQQIKSEMELNDLRLKYAKMLSKYGFYSHFGITVTADNLKEVPEFIRWAKDNILLINAISLIIYRGMPVTEGVTYHARGKQVDMELGKLGYTVDREEYEKIYIKAPDVYAEIKKHFPDYEAMGYLGGTADHESFKWLRGKFAYQFQGQNLWRSWSQNAGTGTVLLSFYQWPLPRISQKPHRKNGVPDVGFRSYSQKSALEVFEILPWKPAALFLPDEVTGHRYGAGPRCTGRRKDRYVRRLP